VNGRTRYGELLHDVAAGVARGNSQLVHGELTRRSAAQETLVAYRELVHGLHVVTRAVAGPADWLDPAASDETRRLFWGHRLARCLGDIGAPRSWEARAPRTSHGQAWLDAARSARTAGDLVATHRGSLGEWRTPAAIDVDRPENREIGLAQLASVAQHVAAVAEVAAVRGVAVGMAAADAEWLVQAGIDLGHVSSRVLQADALPGGSGLEALEVARPGVRTGDPLVELGDRLARVHRFAWAMTTMPRPAIRDVVAVSWAAVLVHQATHRAVQRLGDGQPVGTEIAMQVGRQLEAWHRVRSELQWFRTATPPTAGLRADVTVIRDLLPAVNAGDALTSRAAPMLLRATDSFRDVAGWSGHVVHILGQTGQLYVVGSAIPRDLSSEDPRLAQAKLRDCLAVAPPSMVLPLRRDYGMAAGEIHTSEAQLVGRHRTAPAHQI
jgi:hypothetical protein